MSSRTYDRMDRLANYVEARRVEYMRTKQAGNYVTAREVAMARTVYH